MTRELENAQPCGFSPWLCSCQLPAVFYPLPGFVCLAHTWLAQGQQNCPSLFVSLMWGVLLGGTRGLELLPGTQAVLGKGFLHLLSPHVSYLLLGENSFTAAGGHVWVAPNQPWHSLPLSSSRGKRSSRLKWEATPVL